MSDIQSMDDDTFQARTEELRNRRSRQGKKASKSEIKKSLGMRTKDVDTSENEDVEHSKLKPLVSKRPNRGSSSSSFTNLKASSSKRKKEDEVVGGKHKLQLNKGGSEEREAHGKTKFQVEKDLLNEDEGVPGQSKAKETRVVKPSEVFPQESWPANMTKAKVDLLTIEEFQRMQAIEIERRKLDNMCKEVLGQIKRVERAYIPPIRLKGGEHDFMTVFTDGAWVHFPISETEKWWEHVPLAWNTTTVEFGGKERGIENRIPKVNI